MNDETSALRWESLQQNERLQSRLAQIKSQVNNFAVRDDRGELLGEVKDVNLAPDGHINLVISGLDTGGNSRLFIANSQLIHKIEYATQSVFINLTAAEIERLPEYKMPPSAERVHSELHPQSVAEVSAASDRPTYRVSDRSLETTNQAFAIGQPSDRSLETTNQAFAIGQPSERSLETTNQAFAIGQPSDFAEESIRLLEERLVIDRSKQKVGDVIVRKTIETRMVEVPIRREILIVEQLSPERKQLAEIDLGKGKISGVGLSELLSSETQPHVKGEFDSPQTARQFLEAIAAQPHHGCAKVRVELVLENPLLQETYQDWLARYTSHSVSEHK